MTLPMITVAEWTGVPLELLADPDYEKSRLTIPNKAKATAQARGFDHDGPDFYNLWRETDEYLYVPRAYYPRLRSNLLEGKDYVIVGHERGQLIDLGRDNVVLGPNEHQPYDQTPPFDALISGKSRWGRQLVLRCGAGKTAIALKAAHQRRARTLWVTMNTSLLEQAKKDITRWLGIPAKEIGHIQAEKCRWQDTKIAVAMLQSLALKNYPDSFYRYWDLVIFDEGDVLGADYFAKVIHRFPAERWLLTATQKRPDGMEVMYNLHIGPVCFEDIEYDLVPECFFMRTGASASHEKRAGWNPQRHEKPVNFPMTAHSLLLDDDRTALVTRLVANAVGNEDRTVLVLGDSVEGLTHLAKEVRAAIAPFFVGLLVGQVPQKQRDAVLRANHCVVATTQLAYRGLDFPQLDTLFITSITSTAEARWRQAVGRILRFQESKQPKVVVLVDENIPACVAKAVQLAKLFKKFGWPLQSADWLFKEGRLRAQSRRVQQQEFQFGRKR